MARVAAKIDWEKRAKKLAAENRRIENILGLLWVFRNTDLGDVDRSRIWVELEQAHDKHRYFGRPRTR